MQSGARSEIFWRSLVGCGANSSRFTFLLLSLDEGEDFFPHDVFLDGGGDSMYFLLKWKHTRKFRSSGGTRWRPNH